MSSSQDVEARLAHIDAVPVSKRIARHVGADLDLRPRDGGGVVAELELPSS